MRFQVWWLQCAVPERSTVKAEARKGIPKKTTSGARPGVIGVSLTVRVSEPKVKSRSFRFRAEPCFNPWSQGQGQNRRRGRNALSSLLSLSRSPFRVSVRTVLSPCSHVLGRMVCIHRVRSSVRIAFLVTSQLRRMFHP